MRETAKPNCPLNGFEPCKGTECAWFVHLRGENPQTGEAIDEAACAIGWMPILLIENAQKSNQTGAAVESLRNAVIKGQKKAAKQIGVKA